MQYGGTVYLITNHWNTVLYLGVTSNLIARISEHKEKTHLNSFSSKYNTCKLVWYESFSKIEEAIAKEKMMKKWKRDWKEKLIKEMNPECKDLYDTL